MQQHETTKHDIHSEEKPRRKIGGRAARNGRLALRRAPMPRPGLLYYYQNTLLLLLLLSLLAYYYDHITVRIALL